MKENHELYRQYIDAFYGQVFMEKQAFDVLEQYVIRQLKNYGISRMTQKYLQNRKWDMTNDWMLDATDAMEVYDKRHLKPSYKHMCAVLLENKYLYVALAV